MQLAQKLYEAGKITYMRTDSVNLSQDAMNAAKQEITKDYGEKYSNPTAYKTKSAGAQEAHECIRPAHLEIRKAGEDSSQQKLYDLIRKRTIASQMASANIEKTVITIDISGAKSKFVAEGEVVTFDGFLKVYSEGTDDEESSDVILLPKLEKGENLQMEQIASTQKFKKHAPRYTEASLVKELEKRGIGRPSTYATIVTKIQDRKYVVKESREGEKRDYLEFLLKNGKVSESKKSQNTGVEKEKLFPTQS
jgi:DNA topoisomerase-1